MSSRLIYAKIAPAPYEARRLHSVAVWEESPLFDEKEKAAFAWAESLTHLGETRRSAKLPE